MNFCFYSHPTFESWDWRNPLEVGIGGSETSHVEMAQRLSRRGHSVVSWAPVPEDIPAPRDTAGVLWANSKTDNLRDSAAWQSSLENSIAIIYRQPDIVDQLPEGVPAWLICQDVQYQTMTPARAKKFTRVVALCDEHAEHLKAVFPYLGDKVCVSSNGIRSDLIRERIEAQKRGQIPARNPKRLMFASSPDRGLETLLSIFSRVREYDDAVELHVYYGFNNVQKVGAIETPFGKWVKARNEHLLDLLKAPGVVHHGRIGQRDIIDEWLQAGIWCHPSAFSETSCITCMDAQACGAIPITTPVWAIRENVQFGVFIEGNPEIPGITRAQYVKELLDMLHDPARQEAIRTKMQPWALDTFDWENFVDQWESWADHDLKGVIQYPAVRPTRTTENIEGLRPVGTIARMGGVPSLPCPFTDSFQDMMVFNSRMMEEQGKTYVHYIRPTLGLHDKARNELVEMMRGDFLLMLDSDIVFEPDACARLVHLMYKHDLDVVSGMYPYKEDSDCPVMSLFNYETAKYEPILDWDKSVDLFEFSGGGAGALLVRSRLFERMAAELKERPFSIIPPMGEDISFFARLRRLGVKAYCAWKIGFGHLAWEARTINPRNLSRNTERFAAAKRTTKCIVDAQSDTRTEKIERSA
jgi:glycosyltransferase involved in cell wall biosynthesis